LKTYEYFILVLTIVPDIIAKRCMKKILILAALVYSLIAPITYHPDTKLTLYYASLNNGKIWDIYSYLNKIADDAPKFHYPPMHFWALKAELPIVYLIGGRNINNWLKIGSNIAFYDKNVFKYNLATKMPLLILVIFCGWLIYKILVKYGYSTKIAKKALIIWLFNPITIYSAVMMGQNDILAITPFLIGLIYYFDNPWLAFLMFGIGGSIKIYPLIWALGLACIYPSENGLKKIGYFIVSASFYIFTIVPFIGFSYFRQDVLESGLSIRIFESVLSVGNGVKILVVPMILGVLFLTGIWKRMGENLMKINLFLATLSLIILGFSHFNPQWLMWIVPFVSMYIALGGERISWVIITIAWVIIILLFDDIFLYWGIFSPLNPSLMNLPFINIFLASKGVEVELITNMAHTTIAGCAIYWLIRITNERLRD
jgi:hypothetical protein